MLVRSTTQPTHAAGSVVTMSNSAVNWTENGPQVAPSSAQLRSIWAPAGPAIAKASAQDSTRIR